MDYVEFDGVRYVKATELARELGYTADYVGQLCRAEKIDARLVGRSWYVEPTSLREHRSEKKRSTKELDRREIEHQKEKESSATHEASAKKFIAMGTQYEPDTSELIPQPKKRAVTDFDPVSINVTPADARSVGIESDTSEYRVERQRPPEPPLKGKVAVRLADEDKDEDERPTEATPNEKGGSNQSAAPAPEAIKTAATRVEIEKVDQSASPEPKAAVQAAARSQPQRVARTESEDGATNSEVREAPAKAAQGSTLTTRRPLALSLTAAAILLSLVSLSLSGSIRYDATAPAEQMLSASITFDGEAMLEAIYVAK